MSVPANEQREMHPLPLFPRPLGQSEWVEMLQQLELQAAVVRRRSSGGGLKARAELACQAFGLLWTAWSPELVLDSARASLLLGQPVVAGRPMAEQLLEADDRGMALLEEVGAGGGEVAEAGVSGAVFLHRGPVADEKAVPGGGPLRRIGQSDADDVAEEVEPDDLEGDEAGYDDAAAELELELPEEEPPAEGQESQADGEPAAPESPAAEEVAPAAEVTVPDAAPDPDPDDADAGPAPAGDWLAVAEAAELLEVEVALVEQWVAGGQCGVERSGWWRGPGGLLLAVEVVETLMADRPAAQPSSPVKGGVGEAVHDPITTELGPAAAPPPDGGEGAPDQGIASRSLRDRLRPRHLRMRSRPADPEAAERWRQRQERIAAVARRRGALATATAAAEPEAAAERARRPRVVRPNPDRPQPPEGWLDADQIAERLGYSGSAVRAWMRRGELNPEHIWRDGVRLVRFSPELQRPARLDRQPSEQQRPDRPQPPEGWLTTNELALQLKVSPKAVRTWMNRCQLPAEQIWRGGERLLRFDPEIQRPARATRPAGPSSREPLPPVPDGWMKASEAAKVLGIPLETITYWRRRGDLVEGVDWQWRGKKETLLSEALIERLEAEAAERIGQLLQAVG